MLDELSIGGATPLAAGLANVLLVAARARSQGTERIALLLFTDGRANVPLHMNGELDDRARRLLIEEELKALAASFQKSRVAVFVVDTQNRFTSGGEAVKLADALGASYVYLGAQALEPRQGRKVMVIITDGGDTMSKVDYKDAVRAAEEAEAILYSIIVVPIEASAGRDTGGEHALIQLSNDTGGKYFYAKSLPQLDDAFRQISDELRTQYMLAYYPSQRLSDSEFRRIQVTVNGLPASSNFKVRHRIGYYSSKSR